MVYSIGQIAQLMDVSCQALRDYEAHGFIPKPQRTLSNRRRYNEEDLKAIRLFLNAKFNQV